MVQFLAGQPFIRIANVINQKMKKLSSIYILIRTKIHTVLLSHKKGIVIGNGSNIYYKSRIDCSSDSYVTGGGGDNWQ